MLAAAVAGLLLLAPDCSMAQATKAPPKVKPFLYRANGAMMLQVSKPIEFSIVNATLSRPETVLKVSLPKASDVTVTGSTKSTTEGAVSSMKIAIKKKIPVGTNSLDTFQLTVETTFIESIAYWKITSMKADYTATVNGLAIKSSDEDIYVDKVPGFTHALVDLSCERGYSSCAPRGLSWTCHRQDFRSKAFDEPNGIGANIVFPGLEIQPFETAAADKGKFGYNWDCDPLLSIPLWTSLLIGLFLILALFWSCDMITALNTPDRFDDPKGAPIMVPNTD